MHFFHKERAHIYFAIYIRLFYKLSLIKLYGPNSFEVQNVNILFLLHDLEKAKIHVKKWSQQISRVTDSLTIQI